MQAATAELRHVRVFVSSTFRDMQAERDELVLRIFPQLRAWCEARGVTWTEVDLRWGLTDEEARQERVVPICLAEIENCRPFFLGILGQRYGWVPQLPPRVLDEHPWLSDLPACSVTEMEILHGAMREPANSTHSFFYFRAPEVEPPEAPEPPEAGRRQEQLKDAIRRSGLPLRETFQSPRELGQWVLEDFSRALAALFPENVPPAPEDYEPIAQRHWRNRLSRLFVGPEAMLEEIDRRAGKKGLPILLCSDEGGGKSTLLAAWARARDGERSSTKIEESPGRWFERFVRPAAVVSTPLVVFVAVGATPFTSQWIGVVSHLAGALGASPQQVKTARSLCAGLLLLNSALTRVNRQSRVVIALDGVEQLPGSELDQAVAWAARATSVGVRIVLTCMPGKLRDFAVARRWPVIAIPQWNAQMRGRFTEAYLGSFSKKLSLQDQSALAATPAAGNPLFLRVVLDELRVFGSHEELGSRLRRYANTQNLRELIDAVLERYEHDYEDLREDLVRDTLRLLWVARRGLSEAELRDLLGDGRGQLPAAVWSPLYLALRGFTPLRGGLLSLVCASVRNAVEQRYLPHAREKLRAHAQLAAWFESRRPSLRRFEELSWHLIATDAAERLSTFLAEPETLATVADVMPDQWRAHACWLETRHNIRPWERFDAPAFESQPQAALGAAGSLADLGYWTMAAKWFVFARQQTRPDEEELRTRCLVGEAAAQTYCGETEKALSAFLELEATAVRLGNLKMAASAAGNQTIIFRRTGRIAEAWAAAEREATLARQSSDAGAIVASHGHRGALQFDAGRAREALVEFDAQLQRAREISDLTGMREALINTALVFDRLGRLNEALRVETEVEDMCSAVRDLAGLANALGQQASILQRTGDLDGALQRLERAEEFCPEIEDRSARARILARLAELWADGSVQRYLLAHDLVKRALDLATTAGDQRLQRELRSRLGWLQIRVSGK